MASEIRDASGSVVGYRLEHTAQQVDDGLNALATKQDALTFDAAPTRNSTNPVTSGGVYTALSGKQGALSFDSAPTQSSTNPVTSGGIWTALAGKQDVLTLDSTPSEGSTNPVTSGGVWAYLAALNSNDTSY